MRKCKALLLCFTIFAFCGAVTHVGTDAGFNALTTKAVVANQTPTAGNVILVAFHFMNSSTQAPINPGTVTKPGTFTLASASGTPYFTNVYYRVVQAGDTTALGTWSWNTGVLGDGTVSEWSGVNTVSPIAGTQTSSFNTACNTTETINYPSPSSAARGIFLGFSACSTLNLTYGTWAGVSTPSPCNDWCLIGASSGDLTTSGSFTLKFSTNTNTNWAGGMAVLLADGVTCPPFGSLIMLGVGC